MNNKKEDELAYQITTYFLGSITILVLGTIFGTWIKFFWIEWVLSAVAACYK